MDKEGWAYVVISLFLLAVLFGAVVGLSATECNSKTAHIGFNHYYGFWEGCMIEVKENQWVPLDNYYFKQE